MSHDRLLSSSEIDRFFTDSMTKA